MVRLLVLLGGLLAVGSCRAWADGGPPPTLPADIGSLVDQALAIVDQNNLEVNKYVVAKAKLSHQFVLTINKLGARLEGRPRLAERLRPAEGTDIRAKLVAIAWDKWHQPEFYDELAEQYIHAKLPFMHVSTPPPLREKHATEKYRLAWEYFLLKPPDEKTPERYLERIIQALTRIRNPASVLTLLYRYRASCRVTGNSATLQGWLLRGLEHLPSPQGLRALLECVELTQRQQAQPGAKKSSWDPERSLREFFAGRYASEYPREVMEQWARLLATFPRDELPPSQRQLLDRVAPPK